MAKYKTLEEDRKRVFLNESPWLEVLTVSDGWHQDGVKMAKKVCDLLNVDHEQASQPNPAIAVIEAELNELEQNYKDMPNHAEGIAFAIREFSIVLNKVKNLSR